MKHLLIAFLSMATITSHAQTADQIIDKYAATVGGLDAHNKTNSMKLTGTITVQGMDLPITQVILNGKGVRTDVEVMGTSVISAYANGKAWMQNQFAGMPDPTDVTGSQLAELKSQSNIAMPLLTYKADGNKVELLGKEKVNNAEAWKIKLTRAADGEPTTFFINAADNSLIKSVANQDLMGQSTEVETWYSDLKEVNGIKIYMSYNLKAGGADFQLIKFDVAEANVPVDEKIFNKP